MAGKADFTPEEWKAILGSPMLAGMAVTLGDPSGLWGTMKEGIASGRALLEAKNEPGANELVKALVPQFAVGREPGVELHEARRLDAVDAALSVLADVHQAGVAQDA